mmetsp:Transcript_55868/g.142092  ORF Transcript_55868/g.142092 Transcript_55868/m.142092 type:complete len:382 (+) Transcript_55868:107-1252(+)
MPMNEQKFRQRASVTFGRPSSRKFKSGSGAGIGSIGACFDGCFSALMAFPTENPGASVAYPEPKPLEPLTPCISWEALEPERKVGVTHVEVGSAVKECSVGWVNQDAKAACAPPGKCEARGDLAAGTKCDASMFFCVFDGHGKNGHEVSAIAAERLPAHLAAQPGGALAAPRQAIEAAFRKTDEDIYQGLGPKVEYSGSTGVAVIMDPDKRMLHVGNVGDSRAVVGQCMGGQAWNAHALTTDNKADSPDERERIELSGGTVMPMEGCEGEDAGPARVWDSPAREKPGLAVSRSLGDGAGRALGVIAEPVYTTYQLQPMDRFMLIASDGLWDSLGNEQAVKITAKYLERNLPHVSVKALTEAVRREEGGQLVDDTTVVLVIF